MKHCINCEFFSKELDVGPAGKMVTAFLCQHEECTDPVTAEPLPCAIARRESTFCGLIGKYYKLKEEKAPAPVVQLVTS